MRSFIYNKETKSFADVDTSIAQNKRTIKYLEKLKAGLIDKARNTTSTNKNNDFNSVELINLSTHIDGVIKKLQAYIDRQKPNIGN